MKRSLFKCTLLASVLTFSTQLTWADHLIECPSVETLKTYDFGLALPYAYKHHQKKVSFISIALDPVEMAQNGLIIYPLPVAFEEDPETMMQTMVAKLQLETSHPMTYRVAKGTTLTMCVYSVRGNHTVNAFLLSHDGEEYGEPTTLSQQKSSKREQAMKFMQWISMK